MIDLYGIVSIPFLKKSAFSGSFRQMRYRLEKAASDEGEKLRATCWWRDVCWEKVLEEEKHCAQFSFDKEGLAEAVAWMNQKYEEEKQDEEQEN
nr:hypothetical protein [uncultured Faecalimonas sp.]